jgi:hypothetical protein
MTETGYIHTQYIPVNIGKRLKRRVHALKWRKLRSYYRGAVQMAKAVQSILVDVDEAYLAAKRDRLLQQPEC